MRIPVSARIVILEVIEMTPGGCTLSEIEGSTVLPHAAVAAGLQQLVDLGLVDAVPTGRYELHPGDGARLRQIVRYSRAHPAQQTLFD